MRLIATVEFGENPRIEKLLAYLYVNLSLQLDSTAETSLRGGACLILRPRMTPHSRAELFMPRYLTYHSRLPRGIPRFPSRLQNIARSPVTDQTHKIGLVPCTTDERRPRGV